jgi:hypothetical membrane protein
MPLVPWWALLSSGCAPVVLIIGWALAASWQPAGYDPMVQSISALAAQGAVDPWLMTGALYLLGVCHLATALGLRTAAPAGRLALACGGVASLLVALCPEPGDGGTSLRHLTSTGVGFTVLALWPVLGAVRRRAVTWALRPATGYTVTALMAAGAAWFLLDLHGHGDAGFVERVLTGAQSIWPLIVVTACLADRLRAPAPPLPADAASRRPSRTR